MKRSERNPSHLPLSANVTWELTPPAPGRASASAKTLPSGLRCGRGSPTTAS
ncbi:MAG: hypothetical protein OXG81_06595 [Acidobacteria bacterium]|nr:hypothetical protein [Acidobacteriota bacterium]